MSRYRIIKPTDRDVVIAQVWRWWWPFWTYLAGYSTLYLANVEKAQRWCQEAIDVHRGETPPEPKFVVLASINKSAGDDK